MTKLETIADYFGVDPLLEDPSTYDRRDPKLLRRYESVAADLMADLEVVLRDLNREIDHSISYVYCVDFNAIFSALNWFSSQSREAAWSRTAFDLDVSRMILLPGATYELVRYVRRSRRTIHQTIGRIGLALEKAFREFQDVSTIASSYTDVQSKIESTREEHSIDVETASYLDLLVFWRLSSPDPSIRLSPHLDTFYRAAYELAQGERAQKLYNNRADALDYAIVHELNLTRYRRGEHYVILSGAPSFLRLSRPTFEGEEGSALLPRTGCVRTPRMVAMHQLLHVAGGDSQSALQLALRANERLILYRSQIAARLGQPRTSGEAPQQLGAWETPEDVVIRLLASVESVQQELQEAKKRRTDQLGRHLLRDNTSEEILRNASSKLREALNQAGFSRLVNRFVEPEVIDLKCRQTEGFGIDEWPKHYVIMAGRSTLAYCHDYKDYFGLYCPNKVPLMRFIQAFNHVRNSCVAARTLNLWSIPEKRRHGVTIHLKGETMRLRWRDVTGWPVNVDNLSNQFECRPTELKFVRLDTPWFDASFENGQCGILTHLPILDAMADFVHAIGRPVEHGKIRAALQEIFPKAVPTDLVPER